MVGDYAEMITCAEAQEVVANAMAVGLVAWVAKSLDFHQDPCHGERCMGGPLGDVGLCAGASWGSDKLRNTQVQRRKQCDSGACKSRYSPV